MISVFLHILLLSAVLVVVSRKISKSDDRTVFVSFMLLKISCGILVGILYWSHYDGIGDTVYFYEQAQSLYQYFQGGRISIAEWLGLAPLSLAPAEFSAQSEPRTFFFVRLISFVYAFTQGNYLTISIYFSFFAGLATWTFAYQLAKFSTVNKFIVYFALLFIPSIAFWSSGLLKESLMTLALYVFGFSVLNLMRRPRNWLYSILAFLSIFVLWRVKYYVPITLLPIVVLTLIFYRKEFLNGLSFSKKLMLYFCLLIMGGLSVAYLHPVFSSGRFFELLRISHDVIADNSAEAIIIFTSAEKDSLFFFKNLPLAWLTGFFRPFLWESFGSFSLLWAVEKTIFSVLAFGAIIVGFKLKYTHEEKWWGIAILMYASVLATVISLATPNFGTLIRYEVAYMPFLWLMVLVILHKHYIRSKPFKQFLQGLEQRFIDF